MGRRMIKLAIDFQSSNLYYCGTINCLFCQTEYPVPPVVVIMSEILANGEIPETADHLCPACILSDAKTLAATARATVKRNRAKKKEIRAKAKVDRTKEEQDFMNGDEDFSYDLNRTAKALDRLGDISKIVNHDLAVAIAKHYTGKRIRKAA